MKSAPCARTVAMRALIAAATLHAAAAWAKAEIYNVADLYSLGGDTTVAAAINDSAEVVGYSTYSDGQTHAVIHRFGQLTSLEAAIGDGNYSQATAINPSGTVVGFVSDGPTSSPRGFIYDSNSGTATLLGTLGGTYLGGFSQASGINAGGLVVGSSYVGTGAQEHAFIYDPSTQAMTDIGTLGADAVSAARFIDYYGHVAGVSVQHIGDMAQRTFFYDGANMTDVGALVNSTLGDVTLTNSPSAMNDYELIGNALTGSSFSDPQSAYHVFLFNTTSKSVSLLANTIGGLSTAAYGANESGMIVGAS
ncbi:MAG: hypothetical protein ACTHN5_18465 [Phycisphaerae bacterium]